MQAVLYTKQLEPITVVNISMALWEELRKMRPVMLAVQEPLDLRVYDTHIRKSGFKTVCIFAERLIRGDHETLMLFTHDEEDALMLKADFLPGQHKDVRQRERSAFGAGLLTAMMRYKP